MIIHEPKEILGQWLSERLEPVLGYRPEVDENGQYIGLVKDGRIQAVLGYTDFNGASIRGALVGEGKRWMTREYLWYCFYYPFVELGVRKVMGIVAGDNPDAMRLNRHLGFVEEAVIKDACPNGDMHILTMTATQCRFLNVRRP